MADAIHTNYHSFERVELPEDNYQGLLATFAPRLFPGFRWFEFKPRVRGPYGEAQPDAALINEDGTEWWVVEIELSRHGVEAHVDDQLRRLRDAWYSRQHLAYIADRYRDVDGLLANLRPSSAQFLVIVDDHSGLIERAARENDFDLLHVLPFRSIDQNGPVLYATCVEGRNPLRRSRRDAGVALAVEEMATVVRLKVQVEDAVLPEGRCDLVIGTRMVKAWVERDRRGLVLALTAHELYALLGERDFYWLATNANEAMRLSPLD
jgi:hypothetical protein